MQNKDNKRVRRPVKKIPSVSTNDTEIKDVDLVEETSEPVIAETPDTLSAVTDEESIEATVIEEITDIPAAEPITADSEEEVGNANIKSVLKTGGVLLIVCAMVTLVLSLVNFLTKDIAAENKKNDRDLAIKEIFPTSTSSSEIETTHGDPINGVYKVMENDTHIGYAVGVVTSGFGGDIEMLVGIGSGGTVSGVKIISMSETPNVGSRVNDSTYLSGYNGKSGALSLKEDIDAISGATISSKAVLDGVNAVLTLELKVDGVTSEDTTTDVDTTEAVTIDVSTPIPPNEGLETVPVTGEVPSLGFDTLYREETVAPPTEKDETSIIDFVTEPDPETSAPDGSETTSSDGDVTEEPVSSDTAPMTDTESPAA
ncbi:MAG: FMN-binding protein [Clostridia bacterium]|nr:FMN-binding protein [Clostridia bacterium]